MNILRKIKKHVGWTIYEAFSKNENDGYKYAAFLPDDGPDVMGSPGWQADNLQEIIDFINSY